MKNRWSCTALLVAAIFLPLIGLEIIYSHCGLTPHPPPSSLSELCPLPPCGIIRLPNRGRGEGLFSCHFSLSLGWLDRPLVAGGLVEHFQRITIDTAPSGTYFGGNLTDDGISNPERR